MKTNKIVVGMLLLGLLAVDLRAETHKMTADDIRRRLEIVSEMFIVDKNGALLEGSGEKHEDSLAGWYLKPASLGPIAPRPIRGEWISSSQARSGAFALVHTWEVKDDGNIEVSLKHYANRKLFTDMHEQFGELLKTETHTIHNMEAISYPVAENERGKFIIRFTPRLNFKDNTIDVADMRLAGDHILVLDDQGRKWLEGSFSGKYVGLRSHYGMLGISYLPFAGAKEMGLAFGNQIIVWLDDKMSLTLTSTSPFVPPQQRLKVYGIFDPNRGGPNQNALFVGNRESSFLKQFSSNGTPQAGIGIALASRDGKIFVGKILPNSGAELSGKIHKDDQIIAVAERGKGAVKIDGMKIEDVVALTHGSAGSVVVVTVIPAGDSTKGSLDVPITRSAIKGLNVADPGDEPQQ